jgi:RNA polymerase sigma-70 factor, ECF subfamily
LTFTERNAGDARADAAALIDRIVEGDQSALGELYDAHSRLLFGLILRIVRDRSEAEEVLQEVFVQAWTRASTYHAALGSPVAWLVGIARNRSIDRVRARAVRGRLAESTARPPDVAPHMVDGSFEAGQLDVQRALDALPAEERELIEQSFFYGFTHAELAERYGLPLGTVKTRIRRGMIALRSRLDGTLIRL